MHQGQDDLTIDGCQGSFPIHSQVDIAVDLMLMRDAGDSVDLGLHNRLLDKLRGGAWAVVPEAKGLTFIPARTNMEPQSICMWLCRCFPLGTKGYFQVPC